MGPAGLRPMGRVIFEPPGLVVVTHALRSAKTR